MTISAQNKQNDAKYSQLGECVKTLARRFHKEACFTENKITTTKAITISLDCILEMVYKRIAEGLSESEIAKL